ncbi:MAG TPA: T9SS type A sorting domain-containing protein [Flavobacteriales bacterium]
MLRIATSLLLASTLGSALNAQYAPPDPSGFQGLIVERYYVADANDAADTDGGSGLTAGATTYRVYVDLKPGYKLLTVGGYPQHALTIGTSTTFFNNDDRGEAWGDDLNDIHLDKNTVAIDSWLSMGGASDAHWGVLKSADTDGSIVGGENNDGGSTGTGLLINEAPAAGIPLTTADGLAPGTPPGVTSIGTPPTLFEAGGANVYTNDNFAWAVLGGTLGPDTANRILIGQFTTDGILSYCLNIWVKLPDELVCADPNCHEYMEFYSEVAPSDTAGGGFNTDNKFTHPTLCFNSSAAELDCENVPGGSALPGTACDDGNADTTNDLYQDDCSCAGEDCEGVVGGSALPGTPCDDGDPNTGDDIWATGCICSGTVGITDNDRSLRTITVAPNPTADQAVLRIAGLRGERVTWTLRDLLGAELRTEGSGTLNGDWSTTLDLTTFARGIYFVQVQAGAETRTLKVIKR